jgi:hypothetical protein
MTAGQIAKGLLAFQLPAAIVLVVGGAISTIVGVGTFWTPYALVPLAVATLIGGLVTWGIESVWPLPAERTRRRWLRYQLPTFVVGHLPLAAYAFIAGTMSGRSFEWGVALGIYAALLGAYAVIVVLPLTFLAKKGVVTPARP